MARARNRLNVKKIPTLAAGWHGDGEGLYLRVDSKGARRWVFVFTRDGKRREMGLGTFPTKELSRARAEADDARRIISEGGDPIAARAAAKEETSAVPTFGAFAEDYIASVEDGWRNEVHRQQWRNSLRDHASTIRSLPVDQINTENLLTVLRPIWLDKPETARRVRGRIETILNAAKVRGHRPLDAINPAAWKGHLALLLPRQSKLARGHHAAMPYADVPPFWAELSKRPALAARCLEFTILTAARSGEALGATWSEIDLGRKIWTVPAERMKGGVEHVVPLSDAALAVLATVRPKQPKPADVIFGVGGAARSNMAMSMLLRRMGQGDVTVHGMRSTFRDWCGDATEFPRELAEMALAHAVGDDVEAAYRRGTAIERRRGLMQAWAAYLTTTPAENVVPIETARAG